jgi:hypothetical protein
MIVIWEFYVVTVSRMHCQIIKNNQNELLLEDSNLKFGILAFLQI